MQFRITTKEEPIRSIIESGVRTFYDEISRYMLHNNDYEVLQYSNEQTLAAMFVYGLIRNSGDRQITALQEYGAEFETGSYGRPDIFLRVDDLAMFIECKYDKTKSFRGDHWNIDKWLAWDKEAIFNQCLNYYTAEKLNETYVGGHYVSTMVFKLISRKEHTSEVEAKMILAEIVQADRDWYYAYKEFTESEKYSGLEVYGTFKRMNS